jgi:hypothetical protein
MKDSSQPAGWVALTHPFHAAASTPPHPATGSSSFPSLYDLIIIASRGECPLMSYFYTLKNIKRPCKKRQHIVFII